MILAGDVGGTKTRLALFEVERRRLLRRASGTVRSAEQPGLAEAIESFLPTPRPEIRAAAFGVAGPVRRGRTKVTNLSWVVDGREVAERLRIPSVKVLNDLEAMAWGIDVLPDEALAVLQEGEPDPEGNAAVIAAGTGMGQAIMVRVEGRLVPTASEGGHADFAPCDGEMDAFLSWMRAQRGHVSVERVASGMGLENMYLFFHEPAQGGSEPHLPEGSDIARGVAEAAAGRDCAGCVRAFGMFLRSYGAEAGNLALKAASTAGLYVGGGIAAKNLAALRDGRFLGAFLEKGRFEPYMRRIPVRVILEQDAPLLGAARVAAEKAGEL